MTSSSAPISPLLKSLLNCLDNDSLGVVARFLSTEDLKNFCWACKAIQNNETLRYIWRLHCYQKWNLNQSDTNHISRKFDGMALYPFVSPICDTIIIPDESIVKHSDLCIEYTGPVGENNRSVRSRQYFPMLIPCDEFMWQSITRIVCGCGKTHRPFSRFFSTPYYDDFLQGYRIELRQVAYYEITIQSNSITHLSDDDCVAIGLSTKQFSYQKLMPGWNLESYGYHSDDGAIFHGYGRPLARYGPKFDVNDVVGCGLRYDTNEIFFTLNGEYLGIAFENVSGQLYPTVGIDAQVMINFNFGASSFVFRLHEISKY